MPTSRYGTMLKVLAVVAAILLVLALVVINAPRGAVGSRLTPADVIRKLMSSDSSLPPEEFYNYYVAGRPLLIRVSAVPSLMGKDPRNVHVFASVPGKGWVEVPVRIFTKCSRLGTSRKYCIVPKVMGPDTVLIIKAPPSPATQAPTQEDVVEVLHRLGSVREAYDLAVKCSVGGRTYVIHYLMVISNLTNSWVIRGELTDEREENDFDAWGIQGFHSRVERGASNGLLPKSLINEVLRYYASTPIQVNVSAFKEIHAEVTG